jgi:hypothetical protein
MDGVIVWLNKGIADYNNVTTKDIDDAGWDSEYWQNVLKTAPIKDFFASLEWESNGLDLISWIEDRDWPISFLTRPVKEPNSASCIEGKKIWLSEQGVGDIPVIFERDKENYAVDENGKPNILIDDHSGNIEKWIKAGGIGIHYRNGWFPQVIERLQKLYTL